MCHTCADCYSRVGIYGLPVLAEVAPFKGGGDVYTTWSFLSLERQYIPRDSIPSIFLFGTVSAGDSEAPMGQPEPTQTRECWFQKVHARGTRAKVRRSLGISILTFQLWLGCVSSRLIRSFFMIVANHQLAAVFRPWVASNQWSP